MIRAELFETGPRGRVICRLCAHQCRLAEGATGICRVRKNIGGVLYSLNSDRVAAVHLDPIEKKPLYHFLPGSSTYSISAMGCNFSCRFCQNHQLSMVADESGIGGENISPQSLLEHALKNRAASISYTYTEPTVFFELMLETARLAHQHGIRNVMVTNGYMSGRALSLLGPFLDAANVDLKAFDEGFYKKYCSARLQPVLETITAMHARGIWLEVTTLLIPGLNDDREDIERLIGFLLGLDDGVPWHVSRFFPHFQMQHIPHTKESSIDEILALGKEKGLKYLYGGNLASEKWNDTPCPACNKKLIARRGYRVDMLALESGKCRFCGEKIPGVWEI